MVKTEQIQDPQAYFDYLTSDEINVLDVDLVSDETIEIRYEYTDSFIKPDAKTNVVVAAFTTAYARLKLYDVLDMLQERVLYYDTDSVIFVSKPGEPEPPTGSYLGQLTDELGGVTLPPLSRADQRIIAIVPTPIKLRSKCVELH